MTVDISPVRDLIQLDGGDIEVLSDDGSSVHLRLILEDAECAECVMPKGVLEEVSSKLLGVTVQIDDPRES
ncbi:MAG: Fe-S cluster biosis protein NfuA, 4Fe-4S-binding domain [Actinomycetia bacterium]|nr:Fe-S cluster biosis protein NfuA, 4Fe-4S-binding domain [Actinomycetes bacterium]